jgi:hypothetical protein
MSAIQPIARASSACIKMPHLSGRSCPSITESILTIYILEETGRQHAANLATRPGDARAPRDGRGMAPIVDGAAEDLEWTIVNRRLKALRLAGVLTVRAR